MRIERVPPTEWSKLSEKVHGALFEESRSANMDRYSYALVVFDDKNIVAYSTILEMDSEVAHMQHGGALPEFQKSFKATKAYANMILFLKENYKLATTHIANDNTSMLHLAMKFGFRIVGIDASGFYEKVYLHLHNDFSKGDLC